MRLRTALSRVLFAGFAVFVPCSLWADSGVITTIAGTGVYGSAGDGAAATAAQLQSPMGVAVDSAGNVYIADFDDHSVRKITAATGNISTVAGGAYGFGGDGGQATAALLANPRRVAVDSAGNVYIADTYNHRIRKITVATGIITTVAGSGSYGYGGDGSPATAAQLYDPTGIAVDAAGNLYIGDTNNNRVRKVTAATGIITTIAGSGTYGFSGDGAAATAAQLRAPRDVAVDGAGNVYIADVSNQRIRKITAATGNISTIAGDGNTGYAGEAGAATSASFYEPVGLALDGEGNLYIADRYNDRVRKLVAATGNLITVAGSGNVGFGGDGGAATAAQLYEPNSVAVDAAGTLYIADTRNLRVRKSVPSQNPELVITTLAGTGAYGSSGDGAAATAATMRAPSGVAVDGAGNVYIADYDDDRIRKVTAATGVITTVAGGGYGFGGDGGQATAALLAGPRNVAVDGAGNLYIADTYNNRVRKVTAATGVITTVAGSGTYGFGGDGGAATAAQLASPYGVAIDSAGNLYIADTDNDRIRKVTAGTISTIAGSGVAGFAGDGAAATSAQLYAPTDVAVDSAGNVYVADTSNNRIRKISAANGNISTVAGSASWGFDGEAGAATSALLDSPYGVDVDAAGNLYIADRYNDRIRKVVAASGNIFTIAGCGTAGFGGDGGAATAALLYQPNGVAVDASGNVYIADTQNRRVRVASAPPSIPANFVATATSSSDVYLSWSVVANATYEIWRSSANGAYALAATSAGTATTNSGLTSNTTYLYKIRAVRGALASPLSALDPATTTPFTNPSLSGVLIQAVHLNEVRTAVNAMRAAAGLGAASFTDPTLVVPYTTVKRAHLVELRTALEAARTALGLPAMSYAQPVITAGTTLIRASDLLELRNGTQ